MRNEEWESNSLKLTRLEGLENQKAAGQFCEASVKFCELLHG